MNDTQRARVYAWEGDFADWNTTTMRLGVARVVVGWACDLYGLPHPTITTHKTREYTFSQDTKISFRVDQINRAIALHEVAHYICDHMFDTKREHHSPEWMAIYLWLLIRARIAPKTALIASAKVRRIRWVPLWAVSPKRLIGRAGARHTRRQLTPPPR